MSLRDLNIATSYETTESKTYLVDEFYNPVLSQATKYYRIAGFFSSSALAIAAKGIEGLVNNGGKMLLLVSPELSEEDYRIITEHGSITSDVGVFSNLALDKAVNENLQALAWLLDCGRLEIKIVVAKRTRNSLFHQKVGIVIDSDDNIVSFSGSINETAQAWLNNIEEFKVFRSWESGQIEYVNSDLNKFVSYWKNQHSDIADVYDIPESIRAQIVRIKPRDIWDLNIMRKYRKVQKVQENKLSLFPHQKAAVQAWVDNGYSLLMEMATGTGKTRTAIGCMLEKMKQREQLLVIVATPQNTLSRQWQADFRELNLTLDYSAILDGSVPKWTKHLELLLFDLSDHKINTAVIFTTHDTASNDKFTKIIQENKSDSKVLFICDEVHAAGSAKQRDALLEEYEYRIGLSATPERMFDEGGTSLIRNYFGQKSFEFPIRDALSTINPITGKPFLNTFRYYPIFVSLTDSETKHYAKISQQIAILKSKDDYDPDELQRLYDRRANISKNAVNKLDALEDILIDLNPESLTDTIVFVTDKQIKPCFEILGKNKITHAKITESESASKIVSDDGNTERQEIISQFVHRQLQVLVGIKCLDEGIDIKNARIAILMASSTNPREYVQRVGRVIRQAPEKPESIIYDMIVVPADTQGSEPLLVQKEAHRAVQIAQNASNFEEVKRIFLENGVNIDADQ